ncbi:MAG: hypothetical protein GY714_20830 [Desulfobacterales bacterium]|nr:hypothetical protein [Desulfobacterales bacterium]
MTAEQRLQEAVIKYIKLQYPDVLIYVDSGAGLKMSIGNAKKRKRLAGDRGMPDIFVCKRKYKQDRCIVDANEIQVNIYAEYSGLFMELKAEGVILKTKKGTFTTKHFKEQAEMLEKLRAAGFHANFYVGFEEAKAIIDWYLS